MKKIISNLAMLALAVLMAVGFAACSSDDETVDEILSEKTTTVEYNLYDGRYRKYMLFDYAGSNYVSSDTVSGKSCKVTLRQGHHHLVWLDGLDYINKSIGAGFINSGASYNPGPRTVTTTIPYGLFGNVAYCEYDFEVTPVTNQGGTVKCDNYVTCALEIKITDLDERVDLPQLYDERIIGKVKGLPFINAVSLTGNGYNTQGQAELIVYTFIDPSIQYTTTPYLQQVQVGVGYAVEGMTLNRNINDCKMLCPANGLNDVQLTMEVTDKDGNLLKTTILPKFSLKRGKTTVLCGPLFSGSTSDWQIL